jgi:hypothetical protein
VVAAALTAELQALSEAGRVLLRGAAIAGDPFEPEPACAIADLGGADWVVALDELLDAGLVHTTGVARQFAFRHPLVRRAVYESAKGGWRARERSPSSSAGARPTARSRRISTSARRRSSPTCETSSSS